MNSTLKENSSDNTKDYDNDEAILIKEDEEAWQKACNENTVGSYESYLNRNTAVHYDEVAVKKIDDLRDQLTLDEEAWQIAVSKNTISSYKKYITGQTLRYHKHEGNAKIKLLRNRYLKLK